MPANPCPGSIVSGVPTLCVRPWVLKWPKAAAGLKPAGKSNSELGPTLSDMDSVLTRMACEKLTIALPAIVNTPVLCVKSKTPWLTKSGPVTWSVPPLN